MATTVIANNKFGLLHIYERDLGPLIYWVLQTSNALIWSLPSSYPDIPQLPFDTPAISSSTLVSLCKLIGEHVDPRDVDTTVLALFSSILTAATTSHAAFRRITAKKPYPDVEKANASFESFIKALRECLRALGGWDWTLHSHQLSDVLSSSLPLTKEKLNLLVIKNFPRLENKRASEANQNSEPETHDQVAPRAEHQRKQARPGKGKRGKRKKDGETSKSKDTDTKKELLQNIFDEEPLGNFYLGLERDFYDTVFFMATFDWFKECFDLRSYLQNVWYDVAYKGLNSAVAGALSNTAYYGMIRRSTDLIAEDFPDKVSYRKMMDTMSAILGFNAELENMEANKGDAHLVNDKEMFLVYSYRDLVDFATDYRKNSNGKPTKRMMKEIKNWDPYFDLRRATMEERLKWRRSYTINMLYDLVREFGSAALGLAIDKSGVDVREQILPIHVFYLQLIVDSLTVTKGWTYDLREGHLFNEPANGYYPKRDVFTFFGHLNEPSRGILYALDQLSGELDVQGLDTLHQTNTKHDRHLLDLLKAMLNMTEQFELPPDLLNESRFRTTNPNQYFGLWEYSPFLCSVGLADALEMEFLLMLHIWGHHLEPIILMHLYNMLLREGYLKKPIDLFENLQRLFPFGFFSEGIIPVSDYVTALTNHLGGLDTKMLNKHGKNRTLGGLGELCCITIPYDSFSVLLREAAWDIDGIPDVEVPLSSLLAKLRIARTKQIPDPNTGMRRLEETALVKRAKAALLSEGLAENLAEERLLAMADALEELNAVEKGQAERSVDEADYTTPQDYSNSDVLDLLKVDLMADIDGDHPLCGLNLVSFTCHAFKIFDRIETVLLALGNKAYMSLCDDAGQYAPPGRSMTTSTDSYGRSILIAEAMRRKDEQILDVAAQVLKDLPRLFSDFIYWDRFKFGDREASPRTGSEVIIDDKARTAEKGDAHMGQCLSIKGVASDEGTVLLRPKKLKFGV